MNNKDYLEKIAKDTRTGKPQKKGFLGKFDISPTMIKIAIGGVILVIVMMIIGAIIGGGDKNKERDYVDKIILRTDTMISEIGDYNKLVKSSTLRSMGTSLNAVLTETNYAVSTVLKQDFGVNNAKPEKEKTATDEASIREEMTTTLENGRLNGILDRVYAREMAYQIAMLMSLEQEAYGKTKKSSLKEAIDKSMSNLKPLQEQFDSFQAE